VEEAELLHRVIDVLEDQETGCTAASDLGRERT
jgi:hypothetical protein